MIGFLRGKIFAIRTNHLLLEVGGVGYTLAVSGPTISVVHVGEDQLFYIHEHIREDANDLYGFLTETDQDLFESLLGVQGVGPKVAMSLLSAGPAESLRHAIMQGDLGRLTAVSGVGKKTAQKIILDLKGQLVDEAQVPLGDVEVIEALVSLGYSAASARDAVKQLPGEIVDVSARVREALKYLA